MKPRDKTVLPFALPAVGVLVVIVFMIFGGEDHAQKSEISTTKISTTKNQARPYYAPVSSIANAPSPAIKSLVPAKPSGPLWPGQIHRLPAIETELEHSESPSIESHVFNSPLNSASDLPDLFPRLEEEEANLLAQPSNDQSWETTDFDKLNDINVESAEESLVAAEIIEPQPIEAETDEAFFDPSDSIPDPETLLSADTEQPAPHEDTIDDLLELTSDATTTPSDTAQPEFQMEPELPLEPELPFEPEFANNIVSPIEGPVAKLEGKRPWGPVDLRSVQVDPAFGDKATEKALVATGENKRQAMKAVELGFELIQRGAPYSARSRFIEAMRSISRSLDEQNGTHTHTAALRNALSAYEEASDFFPKSTRPDEDINNASVVSGHDTEVLRNADVQSMTSGQCVQEYLAYAEQEFTKAFGQEEIASKALYGVGRLEWDTATTTTSSIQVRTYRSISLYQSALVVFDRNYAAANELGVLFARHGNYENAVAALRHCVALSPQPTAWQNLANLYRRLGRPEEARWAEVEASQSARLSTGVPYAVARPSIEWVEPNEFNRIVQHNNANVSQMPVVNRAPATASRPTPRAETQKHRVAKRRSWPFGSRKSY